MKQVSSVKPLSQFISGPILKACKAGGYGLVFVFAGTILLLIALFLGEGIVRYIVGVTGAFTIVTVLVLLYLKIASIIKHIDKIEELINTVQETAINITDFAYTLQNLAFKNAQELDTALTQVRANVEDVTSMPLLSSIPGIEQIGKIVDHPFIVKAEDLSKSIVATTATAKTVIEDVRTALVESDPARLKKELEQLQSMEIQVKTLLD